MPTAVLAFDFDPWLRIGDSAVRWETVGIAAAILVALLVAGARAVSHRLRPDDLLFVVLGVVPGAVVGGRIGYVLLHPGFFLASPGRILDPGVGAAELTLAVVGGTLSGAIVAALLDGQPRRWLQVATLPAFIALSLGKLASVLGGSGQGVPTSSGLATAYLGAGPWGSLGPGIASVPSQAIEGLAGLLLVVVLLLALAVPAIRRVDGRAFFIGLAIWALIRFGVAATWRDPVTIGPLRTEQVLALVVALGAVLGAAAVRGRAPIVEVGGEAASPG